MRDIEWHSPLTLNKKVINAPSNEIPQIGTVLGKLGPTDYLITLWDRGNQRDCQTMRAKTFVDLVDAGETPAKAAETVKLDLRTIRKTQSKVGEDVQATLDAYGWMPPALKKAWVRAKQVEVVDVASDAVAADPTDSKMLKILLDATRIIGDDTDIAMYNTKVVPAAPQMLALPPGLALLVDNVIVAEEHKEKE